MINPKEYFSAGLALHGHKCPAMPMGLRAGAIAMNILEVERATDGQLLALVEIGERHCATCFADGVQMITGCTFGKGNIQKLDYGKWGLTLVDKRTQRAVRLAPHAAAMQANKASEFIQNYRMKGVPASQVPLGVVEPLIEKVMNAPAENLFYLSEVFNYPFAEPQHSFDSFVCELCGEMVAEPYGRITLGRKVCILCADRNVHSL